MDIYKKVKNPCQDAFNRRTNFDEVSFGYSEEMAIQEAHRCLNCPTKPCVKGCPVNVRIPEFIQYIVKGEIDEALAEIKKTNHFPSICGRVCPQEKQCEKQCVRAIQGESVAIGLLERYVGDNGKIKDKKYRKNAKKVAIVGSGPAGLACASDCAKNGFEVTIFEALHEFGGVLTYGIPEFRLPKEIVQREIESLVDQGVRLEKNTIIGKSKLFEELYQEGYDAIFIGSGAGLPRFMNIPNENARGVISANEYLTRCNLMKAYDEQYDTPIIKSEHTVVVGGGNVAMDAARCAIRLGKKVTVVYRRSIEEMPARIEEIEHAQEEGINFKFLCNPVRINLNENGQVNALTCVKMKKSDIDASGRQAVEPIDGSEFELSCDAVIIAVGTTVNPLIKKSEKKLETNSKGCLIVDENQMTSMKNVYAGGDVVSGAATVILAMEAGKKAAKAIEESLLK